MHAYRETAAAQQRIRYTESGNGEDLGRAITGGCVLNEENEKNVLGEQVCLITGASRGIGEAIARRFYKAGARLVLLDITIGGAEKVARSLDPSGDRTFCLQADVTVEQEVQAAVEKAAGRFGRIDVAVNVAGIIRHLPIEKMSLEDFDIVVRVNLTGTFIVCKAVVPFMKKQGRGKIVNIASLGGRTGRPGVGVNYAAAKAGVIGLSQTLAREAGPAGIYVNAIAPGPILTELTKQAGPEVFAKWNAGRAVAKDGVPEDVAEAALFLASPQSDWITGVTLDINGGILIR
ncbi:MAG: 3-oxoacyl-ACP reductase FabG [Spirochaetales bacterium]|nr:MAG: 3-oxoacyl-ACP reductase FabG [Spirochaetales bacterium]